MRALVVIACSVSVLAAACGEGGDGEGEGEEGEGEGEGEEGEGEGADVCGNVDLVDGVAGPDGDGAIDVVSASVDAGFVTVTFDGDRVLIFPVSPSRPPALPPAGPATFRAGREACLFEGCDPAYWTLLDDDGLPWFEVGRMSAIDDGPVQGPGAADHLTFRAAADDEVCTVAPDSGGDGIATGVVATDDGAVDVKAGATTDVVIGGAAFAVAVGGAEREVVVVDNDAPCADCPANGDYVFTTVGVVLYRKAP